jgi:Relaxase/Mobilisation nuclease domain
VDRTRRAISKQQKPPKLVHNLVFSMPKGTPPEKLQRAVRAFAREKFARRHRYAMALHTDQGHPHVHVVVRAMSEQGERLNIRKGTLREWRRDFARHLRDLGIEANATARAARGEIRTRKTDGIYRAAMRGESRHHLERETKIARAVASGTAPRLFQGDRLRNTRDAVTRGWDAVAEMLDKQSERETAALVRRFVRRLLPPRTESEQLLERFRARHREPVPAQPDHNQLLTR